MSDAILDACRENPADDEPRLVWADAVGGERGELVVIQCALARGDLSPADAGPLRRRQHELLSKHGIEWSQLHGIASRVKFRRGFVEAVEMDCGRFVDDRVVERAPFVRSLNATGLASQQAQDPVAMPKLEKLFRSPAMQQLDGLYLDRAGHTVEHDTGRYLYETEIESTKYGDPAIRLAAELGVCLRMFGMKWSDGMRALRETSLLKSVERIALEEECSTDDVLAILDPRISPALVALDLGTRVHPLDRLIPQLPVGLRELHIRQYLGKPADAHVVALAERCPSIEQLSIENATFDDPAVLRAFAELRSLSVKGSHVPHETQDRAIRSFTSQPMPALRELRIFANLKSKAVGSLLRALGGQLEFVDFDGAGHMDKLERKFAPLVAGLLRPVGPYRIAEETPLLDITGEPDTIVTL